MPPTGAVVDPLATFNFRVRIPGWEPILFDEVSGFEMTMKFDEVREGGLNEYHHFLPARIEYGNLTLKRGIAVEDQFLKWCVNSFNRSGISRKTIAIELLDQIGNVVMSWTFLDAFPVKWSGPSFKAGDAGIVIETLEIAHRGMQV